MTLRTLLLATAASSVALPAFADINVYTTRQPELIPADMNENEQKVWALLTPSDSTHIYILLETSGLSFGDLNSALVGLDIRDLIRVLPGKHYARRI